MHNYYQILQITPSASHPEIKLAYHSLLRKHHPDKNILSQQTSHPDSISITLLKDAYTTLSSPLSRAQYDASLNKPKQGTMSPGPRPAQVVSLEDFVQIGLQDVDDIWEYPCRCGDAYRIFESDLEKGLHLVACRSCSEVVWVGYEVQEEEHVQNYNTS